MTNDSTLEQAFPRPLSGKAITELPSALVPARTSITGNYVQLEPQDAAKHATELYHASHSDELALKIWDYLPHGPWASLDEYTNVLRQQTASFDQVFYSIRPLGSEVVCGQASFLDIHPQNGVIEIGYIWFAPHLQRTRAATEALFLMLAYAMDDLGYRRMQWRCNSLNKKSRQAAGRLGFRFEGIFYNHLIFKGKNRDTAWYSILDDEWPEVRSIIETWLEPSNFDSGGVAKTSLSNMMQQRGSSKRLEG